MNFAGASSLAVLVAAFIFQLVVYWFKSYKSNWTLIAYRVNKSLFWLAAVFVFLLYFYLVYAQFIAWRDGGELLKRLVPPYQSVTYVFGYHFTRFALYYLISFAASVLFLSAVTFLNKKFNEKFFEKEEPYLGAIAIFLLGNPLWRFAWIYYLIALLAVAFVGSLVVSHVLKKSERFSLYYLWLPVAILTLLLVKFL